MTSTDSSLDEPSLATSVLERVKQHEPAAWERLTRLFTPLVYGWVRKAGIGESDAADVVQDVFLEIARSVNRFKRERQTDTFTGWVRTITQRRSIDFRRRFQDPDPAGGTDARLQLEQIAESCEPGDAMSSTDDSASELVRRGLELIRGEFEERTWLAFEGFSIHNRPAQDVADALGMSIGAVYVAKSRITKRLREELNGLV